MGNFVHFLLLWLVFAFSLHTFAPGVLLLIEVLGRLVHSFHFILVMAVLKTSESFMCVGLTFNWWWIVKPISKICGELMGERKGLRGAGQPPRWGGPVHEEALRGMSQVVIGDTELELWTPKVFLGGRKQEMVPVIWRYWHSGTWSRCAGLFERGEPKGGSNISEQVYLKLSLCFKSPCTFVTSSCQPQGHGRKCPCNLGSVWPCN